MMAALAATSCATGENGAAPDGAVALPDAQPPGDAAMADVNDAMPPDAAMVDANADAMPPDAAMADANADANVDAMADANVDAGCRDEVVSVLLNGGFDDGPGVAWTEVSRFPLIVDNFQNSGVLPHAGTYAAWLGGAANLVDLLYQEVTIPAGTTALAVRGYWTILSQEGTGTAYDTAAIELRTVDNRVLERLVDASNRDQVAAWTAFEAAAMATHAGQTVRLHVQAETDASETTSFFFDSLELIASVCR